MANVKSPPIFYVRQDTLSSRALGLAALPLGRVSARAKVSIVYKRHAKLIVSAAVVKSQQ